MFWKKKPTAPKPTRLVRSRIVTISDSPELGMLTLHTEQGPVRLLIGEKQASELMDECLTLLGFPAEMD